MENEVTNQEAQSNTQEKVYKQAEVDSLISKALKTREENLNASWQVKLAETENKYKESQSSLAKDVETLKLQTETLKVLKERNLIDLMDVFSFESNTLDGRIKMIEAVSTALDNKSKSMIMDSAQPQKLPISGSNTVISPDQMSPEQYKEFRKNLGIR